MNEHVQRIFQKLYSECNLHKNTIGTKGIKRQKVQSLIKSNKNLCLR